MSLEFAFYCCFLFRCKITGGEYCEDGLTEAAPKSIDQIFLCRSADNGLFGVNGAVAVSSPDALAFDQILALQVLHDGEHRGVGARPSVG